MLGSLLRNLWHGVTGKSARADAGAAANGALQLEVHAALAAFLRELWMTSRLVPDAHLAALAIEHGLTLCSTDGDFAKFPGLAWKNPLAAS